MSRSIRQLSLIAASFSLGLILISCDGGSDSPTPNPGAVVVEKPTYHGNIAALLYDNCVSCHQNGGIAPFSFVNEENGVENAKNYAGSIKFATQERTMPPWLADNSAQCNTYEHARWLDDAEIETIANWVDNGSPEGTPPAEPLIVPALPGLSNPSGVAAMAEPYTSPVGITDDYRCFIVDPDIATSAGDQLLTAFEMQPGNDALVHHVILFGLSTPELETTAMGLDALETGPGYTCFGGSKVTGAIMLAGWAPGTKLTEYPQGTGIGLSAGRKMIMQVHYNLANIDNNPMADNSDQTSVKLKYTSVAAGTTKQALMYGVADGDLNIPPATSDHTETNTSPLLPAARIWGAFPHMHTKGKSIDAFSTNVVNGDSCLFNVPRWNFEWQQFFFFDTNKPVTISTGDTITLNCHYDTSSLGINEPIIQWGDGTKDEMCLSFLYVTLGN